MECKTGKSLDLSSSIGTVRIVEGVSMPVNGPADLRRQSLWTYWDER